MSTIPTSVSYFPIITAFRKNQSGIMFLTEVIEVQEDRNSSPDNIRLHLDSKNPEMWYDFFFLWNYPVLKEISSILFTGYMT